MRESTSNRPLPTSCPGAISIARSVRRPLWLSLEHMANVSVFRTRLSMTSSGCLLMGDARGIACYRPATLPRPNGILIGVDARFTSQRAAPAALSRCRRLACALPTSLHGTAWVAHLRGLYYRCRYGGGDESNRAAPRRLDRLPRLFVVGVPA